MLKAPLLLVLSLIATAATAQTSCDKPVITLLRNNQELPATGGALATSITIRVAPAAGCPEQRYRFRNAQITLVHHGRPALPSLVANEEAVNLRPFSSYESGDQVVVFIAYQDLATVAADGSIRPYLAARAAKLKSGQFDLKTDESKGISFNWSLVKQ